MTVFIFWNIIFACAILAEMYVLFLPSLETKAPRYLKWSLCLSLMLLIVMLMSGGSSLRLITITSVFLLFSSNPFSLLFDSTMFRSCYRSFSFSEIHIGDSDIKFSNKVKNLGIHFDSDLASSSHVNALIRTMYLELRKIGKIRHLINTDCATLLVSSLVLSKLDYCSSLLAGLPSKKLKKLQTVQKNAARLV